MGGVMGLYAVIGNPIGHSRSPEIHLGFAAETGQALEYVRIAGGVGRFAAEVDAFRARGGLGLNVTAPFKLDAFRYATALEEGARAAGAVNCLTFDGAEVRGANFDGVGLLRDIEANLGFPLQGRRVLLLGAGGAARGALRPLLEAGPAEVVVVNRDVLKAREVVAEFGGDGRLAATGYGSVEGGFDLVVNATSASVAGEALPLAAGVFRAGGLAYEMAYGTGLTPFLRLAREAGVGRLADGVGMLVEQAAEAFAVWRGVRPGTAATIARMTVPLV